MQPQYGGVFTYPDDEPATFDVHQSSLSHEAIVNANLRDFLIRFNRTATGVEPDLAESWTVSQDGMSITFKLRSGVRFLDGVPFTCADVKYTFDRIINPPKGMVSPRKVQLLPVESVQCTDNLTVVFRMRSPWPDALLNIADPFNAIVPKHIAEPLDQKGEFLRRADTAVGTGAFQIERFVSGEAIRMKKVPNYWNKTLPYVDAINIIFVPATEMRTRVAGLQSGRFQFVRLVDTAALLDEMESQSRGRWTVVRQPRSLVVNLIPDMKEGSRFRDVELRKALALSICHDDFIKTMGPLAMVHWFGGAMTPADPSALPEEEVRAIPGYGKDCAGQISQAREIVERKGQKGSRLELITWAGNVAFRDSNVVVAEMLSRAGWVTTATNMEQGPYYEIVNNRRIPLGMAVTHSIAIRGVGIDAILAHAFHPDGARNYGGYEDAELRDLFSKQSKELDPAKRLEMAKEYQRKFLSRYYHIVLGWRGSGYLWSTRLHNMFTTSVEWPVTWKEVWLEQ